VQVAQQSERAAAGAPEELGVQPFRLVGSLLAVALGERPEPVRVCVALGAQPVADGPDVGLIAMATTDLAEGLRKLDLGAVQKPQLVREMHCQPSTRIAATL
jgi:hypothetical protein